MDLYPDVAIHSGAIKKDSIIARFLSWVSRYALRKADRVIVIGRHMQELLENDGVETERIRMIPNWANEREVRRISDGENQLRKELELDEKFVCLYSGNLGVSHMFEDILDVIQQLKENDQIQFVSVGNGKRRRQVEDFREREDLSNITMLPFQPTERLSESLGLGDIHFVCLRNNFVGMVVPSKAYGAMAAGKPIVYQGDDRGEIARMIVESDAGHVVPDGNAEKLKDAIMKLSLIHI